jgi:hypothetical protein
MRYKANPGVVTTEPAVRLLYLMTRYLPLSDAEARAMACHDGRDIYDNRTYGFFIEVVKGDQRNFVAAFNRNCLAEKTSLLIVCTYNVTLTDIAENQ